MLALDELCSCVASANTLKKTLADISHAKRNHAASGHGKCFRALADNFLFCFG